MEKRPNHRVVVTGIGVVSSIGESISEFWGNCLQAKQHIEPIPDQWLEFADYNSRIWSPLPIVDYSAYNLKRIDTLCNDPATLNALCAAAQAIQNAQLSCSAKKSPRGTFQVNKIDPERTGVYFGTGVGGGSTFLSTHETHLLSNTKCQLNLLIRDSDLPPDIETALNQIGDRMQSSSRYNPFVVSMLMPNAAAANIAIRYSLHGPILTYTQACASSTVSIGQAFNDIRSGKIDMAIAGGTEYLNDQYGHIFRGFDVANTLAKTYKEPKASNRPFDKDRSGFVFSEGGAAALTLEEYNHARDRNAPILAEILGYADSFDAYSIMSIEPQGAEIERMLRHVMEAANISPKDIDYINAHGTGTEVNDQVEAEVIGRIFGNDPCVNSTKSILGHTIGASGAIEAAVVCLSIRDQTTHVCNNLENPICNLNFTRQRKAENIRYALSQSFAFGGHNAVLLFGALI